MFSSRLLSKNHLKFNSSFCKARIYTHDKKKSRTILLRKCIIIYVLKWNSIALRLESPAHEQWQQQQQQQEKQLSLSNKEISLSLNYPVFIQYVYAKCHLKKKRISKKPNKTVSKRSKTDTDTNTLPNFVGTLLVDFFNSIIFFSLVTFFHFCWLSVYLYGADVFLCCMRSYLIQLYCYLLNVDDVDNIIFDGSNCNN